MSLSPSEKNLKKLSKQVPSYDDVMDVLGQLKSSDHHANDRAIAIIGASFVEHGLKIILLSSFVELTPKETEILFDSVNRGPLGTFSDRIKMSYAMDLIGPKAQDDIENIRKIRNQFAHSMLKMHFGLPEISEYCSRLVLIGRDDIRNAKDAYCETIAYISGAFQKKITKDVSYFIPGGGMITHPNPSRRFLP